MPESPQSQLGNKLLTALPRAEYERLLPHLEPLPLKFKQILYEAHQPIQHVYFLQSGVASLMNRMGNGIAVEVATMGREAMIGLPIFLGVGQVSGQTCSQILPGNAMRMSAEIFKREITPASPLHILLQRYTQALLNHVAQLAACNRLHSVKDQYCRWLLGTHDRVGSDQFHLTQESLSQVLGVRRASVSQVATSLQQAGLLHYSRGKMNILNRAGLEASSCECYTKIKQEYDRLMSAHSS
jgi:CRP-like cAMP-binding protein